MKKVVVIVFISLILISSVYAFSFQEFFGKITGRVIDTSNPEGYCSQLFSEGEGFDNCLLCLNHNDVSGPEDVMECSACISNGQVFDGKGCVDIPNGTLSLPVNFHRTNDFNGRFNYYDSADLIVGKRDRVWIRNSLSGSWESLPVNNSKLCRADPGINNPFCNLGLMREGIDYVIYTDVDKNGVNDFGVAKNDLLWVKMNGGNWELYKASDFATGPAGIDPFNTPSIMERGLFYHLYSDDSVIVGQGESVWVRDTTIDFTRQNPWRRFNVSDFCARDNQGNPLSRFDPSCRENTDVFARGVDFYHVEEDGIGVVMGKGTELWVKNSSNSWRYSNSTTNSIFCDGSANNPFCDPNVMSSGLDYYFLSPTSVNVNIRSIFDINSFYATSIELQSLEFKNQKFEINLPVGNYRIEVDDIPGFYTEGQTFSIYSDEEDKTYVSLDIQELESLSEPSLASVYPEYFGTIIPGQVLDFYLSGTGFTPQTKIYLDNKLVSRDSTKYISSETIRLAFYPESVEGFNFSLTKEFFPELSYYRDFNEDGVEGYSSYDNPDLFVKGSYSELSGRHAFSLEPDTTPIGGFIQALRNLVSTQENNNLNKKNEKVYSQRASRQSECVNVPVKSEYKTISCRNGEETYENLRVEKFYEFVKDDLSDSSEDPEGTCHYLGQLEVKTNWECGDHNGYPRFNKQVEQTNKHKVDWVRSTCELGGELVGVPSKIPCYIFKKRGQQTAVNYILYPDIDRYYKKDYDQRSCSSKTSGKIFYEEFKSYLDQKQILSDGVVLEGEGGIISRANHEESLVVYDFDKSKGCAYMGGNEITIRSSKSESDQWGSLGNLIRSATNLGISSINLKPYDSKEKFSTVAMGEVCIAYTYQGSGEEIIQGTPVLRKGELVHVKEIIDKSASPNRLSFICRYSVSSDLKENLADITPYAGWNDCAYYNIYRSIRSTTPQNLSESQCPTGVIIRAF